MTTDPGDLVLDPTCGSGTTAQVAEQWGRRWITIDTSRVAVAIARQRLLTAKFDYYRTKGVADVPSALPEEQGVADVPSASSKDQKADGTSATRGSNGNPAAGFLYKTVPHITLKSIAQNENLDPIFARHEPILEEKLAACNTALAEVTDDLRAKLKNKLVQKQAKEGKRAITDADRRRWELPRSASFQPMTVVEAAGGRKGKGKQEPHGQDARATWQHWQIPFDTDPDWPQALQEAVTEYRKAWRAKQDEVDACIAANADREELVDQPEVVRGVTRVSGPFTVEAVQPPEMSLSDVIKEIPGVEATSPPLSPEPSGGDAASTFGGAPESLETFDEEEYARPRMALRHVEPRPEHETQNLDAYLDQMVRLLRTDGVRFPNNKQMRFSRLDAIYASGTSSGLHAEGRWTPEGDTDTDPEGRATLAVSFGPQYGPVTAKQVEDLVRQANRMGYEDLVLAAFSFDGPAQAVIEEAQHPKLRIHMANIRPDVNPGMDGLLKEQPGSQLFTVFGQPRVRLDGPDAEGLYTVEMEGVDIYNPVENTVTPTKADKVAAWFLDSDYDGWTFCITQAFFPDKGAWDKLARALKGVLDEDAFDAFSGTVSLPFRAGQHKCVAVKVIDPRGNEVMRVMKL